MSQASTLTLSHQQALFSIRRKCSLLSAHWLICKWILAYKMFQIKQHGWFVHLLIFYIKNTSFLFDGYIAWLILNKIFFRFGIIKGLSKIKIYNKMQDKEFHNNTECVLAFQKRGLWNSAEAWLNWALKSDYANHTVRLLFHKVGFHKNKFTNWWCASWALLTLLAV